MSLLLQAWMIAAPEALLSAVQSRKKCHAGFSAAWAGLKDKVKKCLEPEMLKRKHVNLADMHIYVTGLPLAPWRQHVLHVNYLHCM